MKKEKLAYSRREFLNCLGFSCFSFYSLFKAKSPCFSHQVTDFLPPRSSALPLDKNQSKSAVVVVEGKDINKMMWKGLEALELPEDFFRDKKIVIKPNTHWSEEYPSTTDPASIVPFIDFLRFNKSGNITIADGSGVDLPSYRAAFEYINFEKELAQKGVNIIPLDIWKLGDFLTVKNPQWDILKNLKIHPIIYNTPILISMTCLKRHHGAKLSAAIKNNIGAISARSRYRVHYYYGREKFIEKISEVASVIRPEISIIDARDILIKSGPIFAPDKSNLKRGVNKLLISTDMAALDTIASQIMAEHDETFSLDMFQPTLEHANKLKIGNIKSDMIDVIESKA
jgi:uncharacterized protein (DUF362 family)